MRENNLSTTFKKPLTGEEEKYYLDLMFKGDKEARDILIIRNLRLVAHIVKKFSNGTYQKNSDDLISLGTVGLIKGVNSFKADKKTKLSTYLSKCIQNEVLMNLRITKKYKNDIFLQAPIGVDKEGNDICLMDKLEDKDENVEVEVEKKLEIAQMIVKMKEILSEKEVFILTHRYGLGTEVKTQRELSSMLNISRSYVSRIEKKTLEKLYTAIV